MGNKLVLQCKNVSHSFGAKKILHDINLDILQGQFVAIVGPSGCGKSTLLNSIVGYLKPEFGEVLIYRNGGEPSVVTGPNRDCGIVDQKYLLYQNRTALRNVSIGPKFDETTILFRLFHPFEWHKLQKIHHAKALEMLEKVGLGKEANSKPKQLSGGMCQRVAIAQSLIMKPKILLLDEPFGALDEATRENLQRLLLVLYTENREAIKKDEKPPHTVLIVTHELNEAIYVSDRILGLSQYWPWEDEGFTECPGATIVFDEPAPIFSPDDPRDFLAFKDLRDRIYNLVISEKKCHEREEYIKMLKKLRNGNGGVANGAA